MPAAVRFASASGIEYDAGSFDQLRLTDDAVYGNPGHKLLARDVNHRWITSGGEFLRIDVAHPLTIHFESQGEESERYGPYAHFSTGDGIAYADREVFAFADHIGKQWYVVNEDNRWGIMVITLDA
jgi:hypothetical protein